MKDYLLLIRGGQSRMEALSEADRGAHMESWSKYMNGLAKNGHLAGGVPLTSDGKIMRKDGATDGVVMSDVGESIGGYLLLKANDYDHAVALTKACPVFEHGGSAEIREAMHMEM